jgi:hypothetical protein
MSAEISGHERLVITNGADLRGKSNVPSRQESVCRIDTSPSSINGIAARYQSSVSAKDILDLMAIMQPDTNNLALDGAWSSWNLQPQNASFPSIIADIIYSIYFCYVTCKSSVSL